MRGSGALWLSLKSGVGFGSALFGTGRSVEVKSLEMGTSIAPTQRKMCSDGNSEGGCGSPATLPLPHMESLTPLNTYLHH